VALKKPATQKQRRNILNRVLDFAGDMPITRLTTALIVKGHEDRLATPSAANNFLKTMHSLCKWAAEAKRQTAFQGRDDFPARREERFRANDPSCGIIEACDCCHEDRRSDASRDREWPRHVEGRFRELVLGSLSRSGDQKNAHGLRKLAATIVAENGASEAQLMALFGWTDPAMGRF
jgi:hypothetical protein